MIKKIAFTCLMTSTLFINSAQSAPPVAENLSQSASLSRFKPIIGNKGMVSSADRFASEVGLHILEQGGNAIDAAVAVGFTLAVTMPYAGSIGGGGFMMIWDNENKKAVHINYREAAPLKASKDMFLDYDGEVNQTKLIQSYHGSGVPGVVAGLTTALKQYGTLPLKTLMAPAISYAENGFIISEQLAVRLEKAQELLFSSKASRLLYFNENGQPLKRGNILYQKDLARTLRRIANNGREGFYTGKTAELITTEMSKKNALINQDDLDHYQAKIEAPIQAEYRGYTLYTPPPPSSGGVILTLMLNMLSHYPVQEYGYGSAQSFHVLTEIMNLAYRDRNFFMGDPEFVHVPIKQLTSPEYAAKLVKSVSLDRHTPSEVIDAKKHMIADEHIETTHFSVIDAQGNMVANTTTLNYLFGNGQTIPETGILMNNEMDDFVSKAGEANAFGLKQSEKNAIAPQKRPVSSMTPTLIVYNNEPFLATGTPGGSRITTSIFQVVSNIIDHNMNIEEAGAMPRIHAQLWPDEIRYEQGLSPDTLNILKDKGHQLELKTTMGAVNSVMRISPTLLHGAYDPRRSNGAALGY